MNNNSENSKKFSFTSSLGLKLNSILETKTSTKEDIKVDPKIVPKEEHKTSAESLPKTIESFASKTKTNSSPKPLSKASISDEERESAVILEQTLQQIDGHICELEKTIEDQTIQLMSLELTFKEDELKVHKEIQRQQPLTEKLNQLIQWFTRCEFELKVKPLELEFDSNTVFTPKLDLITQKKDYWHQLSHNSTQKELLLQKEIKRLKEELIKKDRQRVIVVQMSPKIPNMSREVTTIETDVNKLKAENNRLKNFKQELNTNLNIERKRTNAKIKRIQNEINRKRQESGQKRRK